MSTVNLKKCRGECSSCVRQYIEKHKLKKGEKFRIGCTGIPIEYIPESVLSSLGSTSNEAVSMLDPVTWAATFLDWHCIDPVGEHWKRKTKEGTLGGCPPYDEEKYGEAIQQGKSIYNRPYQATMLRCTSQKKVFRIGRQAGKTETLCVAILHGMFTHEEYSVAVITPFQSQINLIFTRLEEMIQGNASLQNSISRNVKGPNYEIKLKNGSKVIGFTAGTRSGQDAGSARGQHANMLVFDEADYLSPKDVDAALAMIMNHPDATVWMSSTPTGRREKFYDSCKSPLYKEFHFASSVNPHWDIPRDGFTNLEEYFHAELSQDGYVHEIEAEFGEQEEGVYQLKYIEAAQSEYNYGQLKPTANWTYMIGVDWNDVKIGTTIAVVGFNTLDGQFYLVDKSIVSRGERTQLSACMKIAELNRIWNPSFIYVDVGYGATQIEVLHDYGQRALVQFGANHPDARLRNIIKGFDFGSSVEIRDPFTKQQVKKPAKPFLVENSVRRFESMLFKYPKKDKDLTAQLLSYIVKRVSNLGRPIFEAQDEKAGDHFLDALNLALVAFTLEKGVFSKPAYMADIAFAGRFGEESSVANSPMAGTFKDVAEKYRPPTSRGNIQSGIQKPLFRSDNGDLPAANTAVESGGKKLWSWPGWGHDAPKPTQTVRKNPFGTGRTRPQRAKF